MELQSMLDKAKEKCGAESDNQLSKKLGVSRVAVSSWRHGHRFPDAVTCMKLSEITGIPLATVIGRVGEARAISRDEKAVWRRLASAAAVLLLALPFQGQTAPYGAHEPGTVICIMRNIKHVRTETQSCSRHIHRLDVHEFMNTVFGEFAAESRRFGATKR